MALRRFLGGILAEIIGLEGHGARKILEEALNRDKLYGMTLLSYRFAFNHYFEPDFPAAADIGYTYVGRREYNGGAAGKLLHRLVKCL